MPGRRLLLIGTQWNNAPNRLSFLPEVAERLHKLMTEGPGECVGVPLKERPPGLLLDPTVAEAKAAIKTAIDDAAVAEEPLILVYVGHGDFRNSHFYLMPTDAEKPTSRSAIHLGNFISECLEEHPQYGGLVVLLDACHAGMGAQQAMKQWPEFLEGLSGFEFLSPTDNRSTANAPLIRALTEILERGDPELGDQITCADVAGLLKARGHSPQRAAYNADLTLGRNIAKDPGDVFWKDSPSRPQILKATEYLQPTPQLAQLVEASRSHPVIILTGESGAGKSTLAAALARPELTGDLVPPGFVHAVAMLTEVNNSRSLADDIDRQLRRSVPNFQEAVDQFGRSLPPEQRERLEFLDKKVLGPLNHLSGDSEVRVVLDGFNQLSDSLRATVARALNNRPARLRLILTAHRNTPSLPAGENVDFEKPGEENRGAYLTSRRVSEKARTAILGKSKGSWLITRLLTDAALADPNLDPDQLPNTFAEAYAKLLDQAGAADAWPDRFRPVLSALAVAGPGPILPMPLLIRASAELGGPADEEGVQNILAPLRGLTVRANAGEPTEHVGLFHPTLIDDYLLKASSSAAGYAINAQAAHRALTIAIDALAPSAEHKRDDPLHRYAFRREAHHLWEIGEADRVLDCLLGRESNTPRENLERLREWLPPFTAEFGVDDHITLRLRSRIAFWTGEAGDARAALELFKGLLPDQERTLGKKDRETLRTRGNIAGLTGRTGDPRAALELYKALLPQLERALGKDDSNTLATRGNIAHWTSQKGDARTALELLTALLPQLERVLGTDHPYALATRHNIASWTGETGDAQAALDLFKALLLEQERALGEDHPNALKTRHNIAFLTGKTGDARAALELLTALLPQLERTLGKDHPDVLTARNNIASWTGETGDARAALELFKALLLEQERALGEDHPDSLRTRNNIAFWTGETGDPRAALELFKALLPQLERALGKDHPEPLNTLGIIGAMTIQVGDRAEGLRRLREALGRVETRYGPDHALAAQIKDLLSQHA